MFDFWIPIFVLGSTFVATELLEKRSYIPIVLSLQLLLPRESHESSQDKCIGD